MTLRPKPRVDIHRHGNQLSERGQSSQEYNDHAPSLHSLHRTSQQVRGDSLEILPHQKISRHGNRCRITTHLQHAHSEGLSEDLVGFRVVAVSYLRGSDEEIKRIVLFHVDCSTFQLFLQLLHPLLAMAEVFVCVCYFVCV